MANEDVHALALKAVGQMLDARVTDARTIADHVVDTIEAYDYRFVHPDWSPETQAEALRPRA
jgi:hypothetical protein